MLTLHAKFGRFMQQVSCTCSQGPLYIYMGPKAHKNDYTHTPNCRCTHTHRTAMASLMYGIGHAVISATVGHDSRYC